MLTMGWECVSDTSNQTDGGLFHLSARVSTGLVHFNPANLKFLQSCLDLEASRQNGYPNIDGYPSSRIGDQKSDDLGIANLASRRGQF